MFIYFCVIFAAFIYRIKEEHVEIGIFCYSVNKKYTKIARKVPVHLQCTIGKKYIRFSVLKPFTPSHYLLLEVLYVFRDASSLHIILYRNLKNSMSVEGVQKNMVLLNEFFLFQFKL